MPGLQVTSLVMVLILNILVLKGNIFVKLFYIKLIFNLVDI